MVKIATDRGEIRITNDVLTYLAGEAATSCFGVKGMVACTKEGGPWQLLRRESMSKGVLVHSDEEGSISLELHIGVDYGVNFRAVARSIMKDASWKLEQSTGMPVKKVDVYIDTIIR